MPINHRFHETDFGNGFQTHNAILDTIPYEPEVLFVGTYNPDTNLEKNGADFFYGRNYFWPALSNLFEYGKLDTMKLDMMSRRIPQRGNIPKVLYPDLPKIEQMCADKKICFADFVKKTMYADHPDYYLNENTVSYQNKCYDLINDSHLAKLNKINQVDWSTNDIISFLRKHETIKTVYLTRQPTNVWKRPWSDVCQVKYSDRDIKFKYLQSPAGRGRRTAGEGDMHFLLRKWLFSGSEDQGLDHDWLRQYNVPLDKFRNLLK